MMTNRKYAFELKAKNSVEIYDFATGDEIVTLDAAHIQDFLQWYFDGTFSLQDIVTQLKQCGYTCEAGPLELNIAFIALCELATVVAERTE